MLPELRQTIRRVLCPNPLDVRERVIEVVAAAGEVVAAAFPAQVPIDDTWLVLRNGVAIPPARWAMELLGPGDELLLAPKIQKTTVEKILWGIVFPPLGVYYGFRAAGMSEQQAGVFVAGPLAFLLPKRQRSALSASPAATPGGTVDESPTYGFDRIQNTMQPGAPLPVVYGVHRVGGPILNAYIKTQNDNDTLYLMTAVCAGQVSGITDIQINGQPLTNFSQVEVETRTGTGTQAPVIMLSGETTTFFPVNLQVTPVGSTYRTQGHIDAVEVKVTCPNGLYVLQPADGSLLPNVADILVEFRKVGGTGTWYQMPTARPQGAQRAPVRRLYRWTALEGAGQYDIRISKFSPESTDPYNVNSTLWEGVNEIVSDKYRYPHTAVVAIKALATNQLSGGAPTVTALVTGRLLRVIDQHGATWWRYLTVWSDTPAWVVWDLLTSRLYGFGKFFWKRIWNSGTVTLTNGSAVFMIAGTSIPAGLIRRGMKLRTDGAGTHYIVTIKTFDAGTQTGTLEEAFVTTGYTGVPFEIHRDDLDLTSLYDWAAYTDQLVTNPRGVTTKRAAINFVLDTASPIWDVVLHIASLGLAALVKIGTYVYARVEKPETPVQVFNMANIVRGSFQQTYTSLKDRVNAVQATYRHAGKNFEQDTILWEDEALTTNSEQPRPLNLNLIGITDPDIGRRLLQREVNKNRLLRRVIAFEVGLDIIRCQPYDVVSFQHDLPQWGFGGRVLAGGSTSTVVLDRAVTLEAGTTYELMVRANATDTAEIRTVTTGAGTWTSLTVSPAYSSAPAADDLWLFGATGLTSKPFRIIQMERTNELTGKITAIEYIVGVYDEVEPEDIPVTNYSALPDVSGPPGPVQNLRLFVLGGAVQSVWVSFEPPGSLNYREANIYREFADRVLTRLGRSASGAFALAGVRSGEVVTVRVTTVSTTGVESSLQSAPRASLLVTFTVPSVEGLNVVFTGGLPFLLWEPVVWPIAFSYEVRRGASWETATLIDRVPAGITRAPIQGDGLYWVAVVDSTGSTSTSPASRAVVLPTDEADEDIGGPLHSVHMPGADTGWSQAGIGQDLTVISHQIATLDEVVAPLNVDLLNDWDAGRITGIKLNGLGLLDSVADWDAIVSFDALGGGYDNTYPSGLNWLSGGALVFPDEAPVTVQIRQEIEYGAEGAYSTVDEVPDWDSLPSVDMDWERFVTITPKLAVVEDVQATSDTLAYRDGTYRGIVFNPLLFLESSTPYATPVLRKWWIDMTPERRTIVRSNVVVPVSGLRLTFAPRFHRSPSIQATIINGEPGDEVDIADQSATQATIRIRREGLFRVGLINYTVDGV